VVCVRVFCVCARARARVCVCVCVCVACSSSWFPGARHERRAQEEGLSSAYTVNKWLANCKFEKPLGGFRSGFGARGFDEAALTKIKEASMMRALIPLEDNSKPTPFAAHRRGGADHQGRPTS
jgi:hypothetical protein